MKISLVTPTHRKDPKFLIEAWGSVKNQTYKDWEWVIVKNGEGSVPKEIQEDKRVRVLDYKPINQFVGEVKNFAFNQGQGEVLFELDHDDLLHPEALEKCAKAFQDKEVVFAYSNASHFRWPSFEPFLFGEGFGWEYEEVEFQGRKFKSAISRDVSPASLAYIWYAPDHFRAWRKDFYVKIGGHNKGLKILDDQELMVRTYLAGGKMEHINECLYFYRVHGDNAWLQYNQEIQNLTVEMGNRYLYNLAEEWTRREGLRKIDMGGRFSCPVGYESLDLKDAHIIADANEKLPLEDNSIGIVRAFDFLEHIQDKQHIINEIFRVLVPGGWLLSMTPSTDGRGAFQDPTHVSYWNQNSFWYYTREEQAKYIDNNKIRFAAIRLMTGFPSPWHIQNNIPYVYADLVALKGQEKDYQSRPPGIIEI